MTDDFERVARAIQEEFWGLSDGIATKMARAAIAAMQQAAAPPAPPAEAPLPEHAAAVLPRNMTPEESAILADALHESGKLEYPVPAVDLGPGLREAISIISNLDHHYDREMKIWATYFIAKLEKAIVSQSADFEEI